MHSCVNAKNDGCRGAPQIELMPPRPLLLKAIEPPERPEGIPDGMWAFPRNLADEGNRLGWGQEEVGERAGVSQSTVARWLRYEGIAGIPCMTIMLLEQAMGLPHGALTLSPQDLRRILIEAHPSLVATAAARFEAAVAGEDLGKPTEKPIARPRTKLRKR